LGLVGISLLAGIGITTVGPGGVLMTIGLFTLTALPPPVVAGTSIVTHIATGLAGTLSYVRSGHLRAPATRRMASILALTALAATPLGVLINARISHRLFGVLLGSFVGAIAVVVWHRQRRSATAEQPERALGAGPVAIIGTVVAIASGLFGVGGPMMTVPILVAGHVPILLAVAAAQAQSLAIATVGTIGYAACSSIDWRLAVCVGVPEIVGVIIGWKIARRVPSHRLSYALALILLALAPYLALCGG
jgi:uncharacterized membrane protein YfcA